MQYYMITQSGRQMINQLRESDKDDEADILDFLRKNGASTSKRISGGVVVDESKVMYMLSNMAVEGWVKRRRTKGTIL